MQDLIERITQDWRKRQQHFARTMIRDKDESAFIQEIARDFTNDNQLEHPKEVTIAMAIDRAYNRHLYANFLSRWQNPGDPTALELTNCACQEIRAICWRIARYNGHDPDIAEELAQMVLTRLIEEPYQVRDPGAFTAWIMWKIRDLRTRKSIYRPLEAPIEDAASDADSAAVSTVVAEAEAQMLIEEVMAIMHQILPPRQIAIVYLTVIKDLKPREAAEILGLPSNTVRVEKSRALHSMRSDPRIGRMLEEYNDD